MPASCRRRGGRELNQVAWLVRERRAEDKVAALRLEQLPKWLLCIPLVLQWLWLGVRWRSLTLPSAANPGIETGGLAGESKSDCLAQIDARYADNLAEWRRVAPGQDAIAIRAEAGFSYPLIVKPDIGWCGYGVRLVHDDAGLADYMAEFPSEGACMLQRYVAGPCEAGLYYCRWPGSLEGSLLAITLRHAPTLMGDGVRSVTELLAQDTKVARCAPILSPGTSAKILSPGERITVTTVASLRVGARYEDITEVVTPSLVARIDEIARSMGKFHVGRFDVRFETVSDLRLGIFSIIEVNGAGSEAIHLWDPAMPIIAALDGVFAKQAMLFQLGNAMRKRGYRPVGVKTLVRAWLSQQHLIRRYPASN